MEAAVDVAYREAEERDDHQHVATDLVRHLERMVEQRASRDIDHGQHEHDDERSLAHQQAGALHNGLRHDTPAYANRRVVLSRFDHELRQRFSAARTLPSASTTSGPRDFAQSSQYGLTALTARVTSSGLPLEKT